MIKNRIVYFLGLGSLILVIGLTVRMYNKKIQTDLLADDLSFNIAISNVSLISSNLDNDNLSYSKNIFKVKARNVEEIELTLTSLNSQKAKYEIIYKVCGDTNCNSFIETPDLFSVFVSDDSTDYVSGEINAGDKKIIRLIAKNYEDSDYYIYVSVNSVKFNEDLALFNQINEYSSLDNYNDMTVIAYVNGKEVTSFPTTENYNASVLCNGDGTVGTAKWTGEKWVLSITNMSAAGMVCKVGFTETTTPAPIGWFTAGSDTLVYAIRTSNTVSTASNVKGGTPSTKSEAILAVADDDYGSSYYFRGSVTNNFVVFANMCWRVVRITGDGSVKLVLYNRNDSAASNPCNVTANGTNAFAKFDGTNYKSAFNTFSGSDMNGHAQMVGFMYGTIMSTTDYALGHANNIESTILMNLKTWYDLKLRSYDEQIADVIYCNDISGDGKMGYNTLFNARTRISSYYYGGDYYPGGSGASLSCPDDYKGGKLAKFTAVDLVNGNGNLRGTDGIGSKDYKIGLLTSDEVALAGGTLYPYFNNADYATENKNYYLYENASGLGWWLMSPFDHPYDDTQGSIARNYYVEGSSGLMKYDTVSAVKGIRPVVALVYETKISGGVGTKTSPYKVV